MFMPEYKHPWWRRLRRWLGFGYGYKVPKFTRVVIPTFTKDISGLPDIRSVFCDGPSREDPVYTKFRMEIVDDDVLAPKPGA